jgi:hypothetical protein
VAAAAPESRESGYIGAIDAKVSVQVESSLSPDPWTLTYADDSATEVADAGYLEFPLPRSDYRDDIKAGRSEQP